MATANFRLKEVERKMQLAKTDSEWILYDRPGRVEALVIEAQYVVFHMTKKMQ